jgi:transcriptional regulator with GAF, ATPase, and Fis domain
MRGVRLHPQKLTRLPRITAREREQILAALDQTGWRSRGPAGTAALSGLKPTTLESRIKTLGLSRPR